MNDLFGNPILGAERSKGGKKKLVAKGYAARPGTGPAGETCRTCEHACYVSYSKRYWKCRLMEKVWTGSLTTDIRLKSPACEYWKGPVNRTRE